MISTLHEPHTNNRCIHRDNLRFSSLETLRAFVLVELFLRLNSKDVDFVQRTIQRSIELRVELTISKERTIAKLKLDCGPILTKRLVHVFCLLFVQKPEKVKIIGFSIIKTSIFNIAAESEMKILSFCSSTDVFSFVDD